jgi:DNA-binding CsgD family transcriptional regulator
LTGAASESGQHATLVPLVGRDDELAQLRACLDDLRGGISRFVLVSGEAGIGKTTLVERLRQEAEREGVLTLAGYCRDLGTTPPYGPWADLLDRQRFSTDATMRVAAAAWDDLTESADTDVRGQAALFARSVEFLRDLTAERPLIILLEDLHWADQASLDLLHHVALRVEHLKVLLIATYRDDEVIRSNLLFRYLPGLVRDSRALRITLRRLDRDATDALVTRRYPLEERDRERLAGYIFNRSEGNPLFASELLQSFEADATLRPDVANARWTVGDLSSRHVPPLVQQVIEARLARLSDAARSVVDVAAVIGEDVPLGVLTRVTGENAATMAPGVDEAFDARVLIESDSVGVLRFTHGLVREALHDSLSPWRRREWHQRVAEALADLARPNPDAIAHHFQQAGDDRVLPWLLQAGLRAERSYAFVMAAERYAAALDVLSTTDQDTRWRGWLLFRIGMLVHLSDRERCLLCFEEAARIGNAIGDRMLAAYARARHSLLLMQVGDARAGLNEMRSSVDAFDQLVPADLPDDEGLIALGLVPSELPRWNPFRGDLIRSVAVLGLVAEAIEIGEPYVANADSTTRDPVEIKAIGEAWYGLGTAYFVLGQLDAARRATEQSREWYQRLGDYAWVNNALSLELWIVLWYETDHVVERNRLVAEANAAWRKATGALSTESAEADTDFWTQLLDGRWENVARQAPAGLAGHALITWRLDAANALSTLAVSRGDYQRALRYVTSVLADGPAVSPGTLPFVHTSRMLRIAACAACYSGDLPAARAWLESHDRWQAVSDGVLGRAEGTLLWSSYHAGIGDRATARSLAEQALDQATQPRQPHAMLLAHRTLGRLDRADGRHTDADEHLAAALALADACGAPYERALTLLEFAELRIATGDPNAARPLLAEVHAICEPLGAARALEQAAALAERLVSAAATAKPEQRVPGGLSARELDVLRLIAQGLTDAEAAERLFISRRTVSTHLSSIYSKLGVSSRHAATRFADEHGLAQAE